MIYSVVSFLDEELSMRYYFRSKNLEDCWNFIRRRAINKSNPHFYVIDSLETFMEYPEDVKYLVRIPIQSQDKIHRYI